MALMSILTNILYNIKKKKIKKTIIIVTFKKIVEAKQNVSQNLEMYKSVQITNTKSHIKCSISLCFKGTSLDSFRTASWV